MPRSSSYHVIRQIASRYRHGKVPSRFIHLQRGSCLRHAYSTSTPPPSTVVPIDPILSPAAPPTPPRSRSTRYLRPMITVLAFFLLGSVGGGIVAGILVPPPLPIPDGEEDAALFAKLKRDLAMLEVVKELRSPEGKDSGWIEYEAFMGMPEEVRDHNMSAGVLRGTRGIGLRRMWWNSKKQELVGVVFLGGALAGWPGVVHGGVVATVLMEGIATVGNGGPQEIRGSKSGIIGQNVEDEMVREFGIRYLKPTNANRLFIVRAEYTDQQDDTVTCWVEDALSGRTTAIATGKVGRQKIIAL